jgi:hypothetical protein
LGTDADHGIHDIPISIRSFVVVVGDHFRAMASGTCALEKRCACLRCLGCTAPLLAAALTARAALSENYDSRQKSHRRNPCYGLSKGQSHE